MQHGPEPKDTVSDEDIDDWFYDIEALAKQVEDNRKASLRSQRRERIIFAIFVIVMLAFSWRQDSQSKELRKTNNTVELTVYEQCQVANGNATALIKTLDQIILSVKNSPTLTKAEKDQRVKFYEDTKPKQPVCGDPPLGFTTEDLGD